MSSDDWLIDQHLCRCCHSEGKYRSLTDPMIENEMLFIEALRTCLDIRLTPVESALEGAASGICDECATKLQDVFTFRRQVLRCEESFVSLYSQNRIKVASSEPVIEIKEELSDLDDSDYDDKDDLVFPVIEEVPEPVPEPKKVTQKKKTKSSRVPKKRGRPRQNTAPENTETCGKKEEVFQNLLITDYELTSDGIKCTRCTKTYRTNRGLQLHINLKHLRTAKNYCKICDIRFDTVALFVKHKLDEHNIDDRFKCNACDSIFNSKRGLKDHLQNFHMLGKKIKCPYCDFESFDKRMRQHMFSHKTKDFHCGFCKKSFRRKYNLNLHEKIHTDTRSKVCAECGKAFVQKASLNYHMTKYHPEVKF